MGAVNKCTCIFLYYYCNLWRKSCTFIQKDAKKALPKQSFLIYLCFFFLDEPCDFAEFALLEGAEPPRKAEATSIFITCIVLK